MSDKPDFITIQTACSIVGGERPISEATYYRGVKSGRLPPIENPTPGTARIRRDKLIEMLNKKGGK